MVRRNIYLESVKMNFESCHSKNVAYIQHFIDGIKAKQDMIDSCIEALMSIKDDYNGVSNHLMNYRGKAEITKKDLATMEKMLRKANGYKTIRVELEKDYDRKTAKIIFPKGTKKRFINEWLKNNGYLINKNELAPANQLVDCTGVLVDSVLDIKNSVATVTYFYDL